MDKADVETAVHLHREVIRVLQELSASRISESDLEACRTGILMHQSKVSELLSVSYRSSLMATDTRSLDVRTKELALLPGLPAPVVFILHELLRALEERERSNQKQYRYMKVQFEDLHASAKAAMTQWYTFHKAETRKRSFYKEMCTTFNKLAGKLGIVTEVDPKGSTNHHMLVSMVGSENKEVSAAKQKIKKAV